MFPSNPLRSALTFLKPAVRGDKKERFRRAHQDGRLNRRLERRFKGRNEWEDLLDGKTPPQIFTVPRLKALMRTVEKNRNFNRFIVEAKVPLEERLKYANEQIEFSHYEV